MHLLFGVAAQLTEAGGRQIEVSGRKLSAKHSSTRKIRSINDRAVGIQLQTSVPGLHEENQLTLIKFWANRLQKMPFYNLVGLYLVYTMFGVAVRRVRNQMSSS